ncbi:MAG: hypothetical protein WCK15_24520, partial [Pirellula sp.]
FSPISLQPFSGALLGSHPSATDVTRGSRDEHESITHFFIVQKNSSGSFSWNTSTYSHPLFVQKASLVRPPLANQRALGGALQHYNTATLYEKGPSFGRSSQWLSLGRPLAHCKEWDGDRSISWRKK